MKALPFFSLLALASAVLPMQSARADRTFVVENLFSADTPGGAANYFDSHFEDSQVWLQFENSGGFLSYTDTNSMNPVVVTDNTPVALSSVLNGSFNVGVGATATRVYAALSSSGNNPFSGNPDPFSVSSPTNFAYSLAEFTYLGNSFDTVDTSYEDTFAFPTTLITSNSGSTVNSSGWKAGTQAQQVVTTLSQVMPSTATSRIPTTASSANPDAARYVGTSQYYQTGVNYENNPNATVSSSGPGFNAYLGFLKDNAPEYTLPDNAGTINGWYLDYSGNNGYSGYLQVTGTDGNYGLQISNVRANTGSLGGQNTNSESGRALGTAISGTITIAANGQELTLDTSPQDYTFTGNWTDIVISSGNQLYVNEGGGFGAGPVVTTTGDLAPGAASNDLASTFLATISSIMATGLLGSDTFNASPSSNFWFGAEGVTKDTELFAALWSGLAEGDFYWDPFVEALVGFNEWEGYSFPFQDRFAGLPATALSLSDVDTMTWQLGVPVPEPSTLALILTAGAIVGFAARRSRRL